jgi:O-antigen ligase
MTDTTQRPNSGTQRLLSSLAVVLPLLTIIEIHVVGTLLAAELISVGLVYYYWKTGNHHKITPLEWQLYILALLWLVGAVGSDIYRSTAPADYLRGWAKIVFFLVNFTAMRWWVGKDISRAVWFCLWMGIAVGVKLGLGINVYDNPQLTSDVFGNGWKFGYGNAFVAVVFMVSMVLATRPQTRLWGNLAPFAAAAVNLLLNARGLSGLTALGAVANTALGGRRKPVSRRSIWAFVLMIGAAGYAMVSLYGFLAGQGVLGFTAMQKYELQSQNKYGILAGGRTEAFGSIPAIIDSPIIGHGSWARDLNYVVTAVALRSAAGEEISGNPFANDLIPTHSHLLGAWVEAGILGAIFWFWALGLTLRGFIAILRYPSPYTGYLVFICSSMLWDIVFSKLGLAGRLTMPLDLYLMMLVIEKVRNYDKVAKDSPRVGQLAG